VASEDDGGAGAVGLGGWRLQQDGESVLPGLAWLADEGARGCDLSRSGIEFHISRLPYSLQSGSGYKDDPQLLPGGF
jgi:hypothetical protein